MYLEKMVRIQVEIDRIRIKPQRKPGSGSDPQKENKTGLDSDQLKS